MRPCRKHEPQRLYKEKDAIGELFTFGRERWVLCRVCGKVGLWSGYGTRRRIRHWHIPSKGLLLEAAVWNQMPEDQERGQ